MLTVDSTSLCQAVVTNYNYTVNLKTHQEIFYFVSSRSVRSVLQ